jgi:hypothetical protein
MFRFIVQHFRWLSRIPGFPQFFDALLLAWTALVHRQRLSAMEAIEATALQLPSVTSRVHRFGGVEFSKSGRELGHLHGNGLLDVRVGCENARALLHARRAEPHHVLGHSAWVSFWVKSLNDVSNAMDLLRLAARVRSGGESADSRKINPPFCVQSPRNIP